MDVDELRTALDEAADTIAMSSEADRPAVDRRAAQLRRRRRRTSGAIAGVVLAALAMLIVLAVRPSSRSVRISPAVPPSSTTNARSTTTSSVGTTTPTTAIPTPSVAPLSELRGTSDPTLPEGWMRCTNTVAGFSVGAPATWYTSTEGPYRVSPGFDGACSLFDPDEFGVDTSDGLQAIQLRFPLGDAFPAQPFDQVVAAYESGGQVNSRRDVDSVAGYPAVFLDFVASQGAQQGSHYACYVIDRDQTAFSVCAVDRPGGTVPFDERRSILDEMIATLRLDG